MSKRNTKRFSRLKHLFIAKPKMHSIPHIYVTTESEAEERRIKAHERMEKQKALHPDDVAVAGMLRKKGKLLGTAARRPTSEGEEDLQSEDGFMQHVHLSKKDRSPHKGIGFWTLLKSTFSFGSDDKKPMPPARKGEVIDMEQDAFLKNVSTKIEESAPQPEVIVAPKKEETEEAATHIEPETPSAFDEVTVSPVKKPKTPRELLKERQRAIEENKDLLIKPVDLSPPKPIIAPPKKRIKAPMFQTEKGLRAFFLSLNYIGMGNDRALFIQSMATMLNAGLPLTDALRTLALEARSRSMRKLIKRILEMVENGSALWRAMEVQNFFSLHALALVRIGEEAGNLAENMGYLATQEEKDHALRSKVKMAMIYPTIVLTIMLIIIVGLGTFVLPQLVGVLFSLNVELPLVTRIVIWFSNMFTEHGLIGVPSIIVGFILLIILAKYTPLRVVTQFLLFKIPGIGRLAKEATIARFGVILGGLLKAGVPVIEAIESLVQVTPIHSYRKFYSKMLAKVTIGDSFSKCFSEIRGSQRLLPASVQQLVITGEKSGSLADIMLKIADIYDKKASETAEKLPIILEPMLLIFIGSLVGTIAFAIIIPIYSIVGNVGT